MQQDIFFELGTEELPSALVKTLAAQLLADVLKSLDAVGLTYSHSQSFASPRRIAFYIQDVPEQQADRSILRKGPAVNQGEISPAVLGFARSLGVDVQDLRQELQGKAEFWVYDYCEKGQETKTLLPGLIQDCLKKLVIPKPMRWGHEAELFARPVHWAILLQGNQLIDSHFFGVQTNRWSYGHRFMHPTAIEIDSGSNYQALLRQAYVIVDFEQRRQTILDQLNALEQSHQVVIDKPDALLDEICSINEWPLAMLANFDASFLQVPAEVLIASMQAHQKCLAVYNQQGQLLPHFVLVSNILSKDTKSIILGNEKVMRARLSDAAFFFEQDRKLPLSAYAERTKDVVFEQRLGSLADKTDRVKKTAQFLSQDLGLDTALVCRAVDLSRCDLMTGLVSEFPELQGTIGAYYARLDQEDTVIAKALFEQYLPRFSGDDLPQTQVGMLLSLVDRLDTLVGIFAIGMKPSAEKDPYKLRRHALAVLRILTSIDTGFDLSHLLQLTAQNYHFLNLNPVILDDLKQFILERAKHYFQHLDYPIDLIQAALHVQNEDCYDLFLRIQAAKLFWQNDKAEILLQSAKRVRQILAQHPLNTDFVFNASMLMEPAEQALYQSLQSVQTQLIKHIQAQTYTEAFALLTELADPLAQFFEHVYVMVEDSNLRMQRLSLLSQLYQVLTAVVALGS